MKKTFILPTLVLGAAFAGTLFAADEAPKTPAAENAASVKTSTPAGWTDDFEAAKKQAAAEGKMLLVDFSGSDWCGWCVRLDKEVFSQKEFLDGAKDKYVLVFIDTPNDPSKLTAAAQKQNPELVKAYGIQGFPTVLLMDAEGNKIARSGYQRGGPVNYLKHLDQIVEEKKPIIELGKKIKDMKPGSEERVKAIHAVLKDLPIRLQAQNRELVTEVLEFDADGAAGMRAAYPLFTILMPVQQAQRELFTRINEEMRKVFEALPEAERKDPGAASKVRNSVLKNYKADFDAMIKKVEEAERIAPKGEIMENLGKMKAGLSQLRAAMDDEAK